MVAEYVAQRRTAKGRTGKPLAIASLNRELEVLRRGLRLAVEWKVLQRSPKISKLRGERKRDRILAHEEEQSYLSAACPLLRDIATVLIDTGLQPGNVSVCLGHHVQFSPAGAGAKYGFVHIPAGKTDFAIRNVPLTARAKALLEVRYEQQGRPVEGWVFPAPTKTGRVQSMQSQPRRALKRSGVNRFEVYCFRHTALTRLGEAGADAFAIQRIAGHSSVLISQRYQHPTPERIESAFTALESYNRRKESELEEQGQATRSIVPTISTTVAFKAEDSQ